MTTALNVIAIAGSSYRPSRTLVLAEELLTQLTRQLTADGRKVNGQLIELGSIARDVGGAMSRSELPPEVEAQLQAIENADLLIVASPVYRGSYPGLLKHLFDLVEMNALIDTPVLLAATGGSERHALVIDHQLRPLFSFFQALTLPIGVYASESDFSNYQVSNELLKARIQLAVERAAPLIANGIATLKKIA
jgi:FMN reductase